MDVVDRQFCPNFMRRRSDFITRPHACECMEWGHSLHSEIQVPATKTLLSKEETCPKAINECHCAHILIPG